MKVFLLVGLGSAAGGMLRYGAGVLLARLCTAPFHPLSTLAVNWGGCLLAGIVWALGERSLPLPSELRLLLLAGFCGGFTTFSSFSLECVALLRQGSPLLALSYLAASLLGGLLLVWAGFALAKA